MRWKLLEQVCNICGPSGREERVAQWVIKQIKHCVDHLSIDRMGNVIALKKSGVKNAPKMMVAAHMDEIGFFVQHIDAEGFLKLQSVGGFDTRLLPSQRVVIQTEKETLHGVIGTKPVHVMKEEDRKKVPDIADLYVDLALDVKEVKKRVAVGDPVTRAPSWCTVGECVLSKALDNRVSVFALVEALCAMEKTTVDFYATFCVQEEVGLRGARVAAATVQPDIGFALDTTPGNDVAGAQEHQKGCHLSKGVGLKLLDRSAIASRPLYDCVKTIAEKKKIAFQAELMGAGGTDLAALQYMAACPVAGGGLAIPTRYLHTASEMCHKKDIIAAVQLLQALVTHKNWDAILCPS